jgi:uncharacterized protein (DUF486 family)
VTRALLAPPGLLVLSNMFMTIGVFTVFAWLYLGETLRWNEMLAFGLIFTAVVVASLPGGR